uniref:Uncharacterized protein n=1 Tax=Arundo donax TaxID=35708 RepID=A0A0A9BDJ0_ARUDO
MTRGIRHALLSATLMIRGCTIGVVEAKIRGHMPEKNAFVKWYH